MKKVKRIEKFPKKKSKVRKKVPCQDCVVKDAKIMDLTSRLKAAFDRRTYQRDYMRKVRRAKKGPPLLLDKEVAELRRRRELDGKET